jgi:hypothetical protein
MFSMDINPMETNHQRNRRQLEVNQYPQLMSEIIHRDTSYCKRMAEIWQETVLNPMAERLIPARMTRLNAFESFGHWGPFAYTDNWESLATAIFINEASMLSWLIASHHIAGNFLYSQCCVLGMFCHC